MSNNYAVIGKRMKLTVACTEIRVSASASVQGTRWLSKYQSGASNHWQPEVVSFVIAIDADCLHERMVGTS